MSKSSKNPANANVFWPPIFVGGTAPTFLSNLLGRLTIHYLAKFGWVPFADLRLLSMAMKQNAEFTESGWKLTSNLTFCYNVGDPLQLSTHLTGCLYHVSFRRYRPLKLLLSCEVVQKMVFGPPICRGRGYHRLRTCVFKLHLLQSMCPIFVEFRSATSEIRWRKYKEERKKERRNTGKI